MTKITFFMARNAKPKINKLFIGLQILASSGSALATGANAAQRPMGIIVFSLITLGLYKPTSEVFVPNWVVIACGASLVLGILFAGKKVIQTVGMKFYKIKHINGFCAKTATAAVIELANIIGMPVSTTQVNSGSVMGTGAAVRPKAVRWGVGYNVFLVWLITMPVAAAISGLIYFLILNIIKLF